MAERDQVLDEPPRARRVCRRGRRRTSIPATVRSISTNGHAEPREPPQVALRAVADRRDHDPLDAVGDHLLDHLALDREVGAGVAEDHAVAAAARDVLGAADDQREERVGDVGDDHGERARSAAALRPRASRLGT